MKKILDILEQKVEWLVLAAGLAFALYMAWIYLVNPPVTVKVGSETLGPGTVDQYILDHVATDLQGSMHATSAGATTTYASTSTGMSVCVCVS